MHEYLSKKAVVNIAVLVSLIFTPMNFDALIIPKLALIAVLGLFLFPYTFINFKNFFLNQKLKILLILCLVIILQMLIVMFSSQAPFEQEFFGRTGRGLGFILFFSVILIFLYLTLTGKIEDVKVVTIGLLLSGIISSSYSVLQRFALDPFNWSSRTNGIIGTLGNPNFQSSFAAMVFIPSLTVLWYKKNKLIKMFFTALLLLFTIYITKSTQGYIGILVAIWIFYLLFFWYRSKIIFFPLLGIGLSVSMVAIFGMLNRGPLAYWLYKISVQSRGDFWRSALNAIVDNPILGVGIDSFGDAYLIYRDLIALSHPWQEITDNAHNYYLEYAATGGLILAAAHFGIALLTLMAFLSLQKKLNKFDPYVVSLFCAWIVFQLQSIISPGTIVLILWNFIISGIIIGASVFFNVISPKPNNFKEQRLKVSRIPGYVLALIAIVICFPLFNSDRLLINGLKSRNANTVIDALNAFPKSTVKYNLFGQEILRSNLPIPALDVAREAKKFNPNAVSAWALIFSNPMASNSERIEAKNQILRLDPLNQEVLRVSFK